MKLARGIDTTDERHLTSETTSNASAMSAGICFNYIRPSREFRCSQEDIGGFPQCLGFGTLIDISIVFHKLVRFNVAKLLLTNCEMTAHAFTCPHLDEATTLEDALAALLRWVE